MAIPVILQQLARQNPMMQRVKQAVDMVKNSQNPTAMMQQMVNNNPNMKQVMDVINQHGGNPEKAFRTIAEQNGFNPDDFINMFKN